MEYGLFFFAAADSDQRGDAYDLLLRGARFADEAGLSAVWTPERHFHPFGGVYPNPAVTGAALAAITSRVSIRAGSVVVPLHHPARIAEDWSVVDNLSRGRVAVSFASGWHRNDFVLASRPYQDRDSVFWQGVRDVQAMWRGEPVTFADPSGQSHTPALHPRPYQPELPTWITTGGTRETAEGAGRMGANLLTHLLGQSVDDLADTIDAYRKSYPDGAEPGRVTIMLHTFVDPDGERAVGLAREPLKRYLRSSFGLSTAGLARMGIDAGTDQLTDEDWDALLGFAADRYISANALIGGREHCADMVAQLAAIGVDEIACLIDFGVDHELVLASLPEIARLPTRIGG